MRAILLDTGVLSELTHRDAAKRKDCYDWAAAILLAGEIIAVPEIADYEYRRKLLHLESTTGLQRLDEFESATKYLPLSTSTMHRAAALWADARTKGLVTAPREALDGDVILAAQALEYAEKTGDEVVVATTNVRHVCRMVTAKTWRELV